MVNNDLTSSAIRSGRRKLGLSQKEFALKVGASPSMVNLWECGKTLPKKKSLIRGLALTMGIDVVSMEETIENDLKKRRK